MFFILKFLSFSFERTKENETKENSSQPETTPPAALLEQSGCSKV